MQVSCRELVLSLQSYMRLFSFILSLYILALSVVPCSDGIVHNLDDVDANIELSQTEHDHNHSGHNDCCTPFCTCACCGSLVTAPTSHHISEVRVLLSTTYLFSYNFDYSFEYVEGVWHPPAIS